ncbi:hypothetical protein NDU88_004830 [Pleurodeles waltl]|uniref:Uncharacterized protein n=1 Tax=Pleurodeles waltl TaxID=8319 RepID=A0AAV7WTJ2_PLEWA|nr:hypothetical protein NDU88_004830 [Pleurodeles waltl]
MIILGNPRWRPNFPADRHYRSSPSPDHTRPPLTRRCRGRCAPAARTAAGASRLLAAPARIGLRRQAPEGPARRCERGARPRPALLFLSTEHNPRCFLATLAGLWGVWDALMAPKLNRTPRSLRVRRTKIQEELERTKSYRSTD